MNCIVSNACTAISGLAAITEAFFSLSVTHQWCIKEDQKVGVSDSTGTVNLSLALLNLRRDAVRTAQMANAALNALTGKDFDTVISLSQDALDTLARFDCPAETEVTINHRLAEAIDSYRKTLIDIPSAHDRLLADGMPF